MKYASLLTGCLLLALSSPEGKAIIIAGEMPPSETVGAGWDYVGRISRASAVYLGEYQGVGWVLTANHVSTGNFVLNGVTYNYIPGTEYVLPRTGNPSAYHDLKVFAIDLPESLPLTLPGNLTFASSTSVSQPVQMIGNGGSNREADLTYWKLDGDVWVETLNPAEATASGYKFTPAGGNKTWGINTISHKMTGLSVDPEGHFIATTFTLGDGIAQGVRRDSGGGVFTYNALTNQWELAGLMAYIATPTGYPSGTDMVVFSQLTLAYDMSVYGDRILQHINPIPEPTTWALLFGGASFLWLRRRQKRG